MAWLLQCKLQCINRDCNIRLYAHASLLMCIGFPLKQRLTPSIWEFVFVEARLQSDGAIIITMCAQNFDAQLQRDDTILGAMVWAEG